MNRGGARNPFGWPLRCPKCPQKHYYGRLKVPGDAAGVKTSPWCINCGTRMIAVGGATEMMTSNEVRTA